MASEKIIGEAKKKRESFFKCITDNELAIVSKLQNILRKYESLEERISYSVLYYFQNSRVCFIWPASIKPGPKSGVQFGFCEGYLLQDELKLLERENRKQVYCFTYHQVQEIDEQILDGYIKNALAVDETIHRKKKRSLKKT